MAILTNKLDTLETSNYFACPVYTIEKPEWVSKIDKACDKHIKEAYKREKPRQQQRKKDLGTKHYNAVKDHGMSYHSGPIERDPALKDFVDYCGNTARNILDEQGFDMNNYTMFFTECWVQEFSKHGGGHHNTHIHSDNHISGFYYLKCSPTTSLPIFHDPRPGALMTGLKQKDKTKISYANDQVHYLPKPGTLIFFNSYMPHQYSLHDGYEDFRFIHFNIQAIRNEIVNGVKGQ